MRSPRLILTLAVSLALSVAVLGTSASSASALPPGYQPNGCTWSPDRGIYPVVYDFKAACDKHDYCYDEMWYGGGEKGRLACDKRFRELMREWCSGRYSGGARPLLKCFGVAQVYYAVVRKAGKSYFNNPNKN